MLIQRKLLFPAVGTMLFTLVTGLFSAPPFASAAGEVWSPPPPVEATAAVLMDVASGRVLYDKNPGMPLPPASTAKILTALVVLEEADLGETVTVSSRATAQDGSSMYLRAGSRVTVEDLLYGLLLPSGNDAAVALAEHVAGSATAFAAMMNVRAAELGATGSRFVNPHGLPAEGQVTTARDLALITRAALQHPVFARIVASPSHDAVLDGSVIRTLYNHNILLGEEGIDGVKTGYTYEAMHTYVASANRDGWRLVTVVLKDSKEGKWRDARALLSWGFTVFRPVVLLEEGQAAAAVRVTGGHKDTLTLVADRGPVSVPVRADGSESAYYRAQVPASIPAARDQGERLGNLVVYVNSAPLFSRFLRTGENVAASSPPSVRLQDGDAGFGSRVLNALFRLWRRLAGI